MTWSQEPWWKFTPAHFAKHAFEYVFPFLPHTGIQTSAHTQSLRTLGGTDMLFNSLFSLLVSLIKVSSWWEQDTAIRKMIGMIIFDICFLVAWGRIELPTYGLWIHRSNQLSYQAKFFGTSYFLMLYLSTNS